MKKPLCIALLLVSAVALVLFAANVILRKRFQPLTESAVHLDNDGRQENEIETVRRTSSRLCSLDTFRGLAIVTMIFANSGAGKYKWLEHATWNGIHPADFIFPSFLWIMGVCIPISIKSQLMKNVPRKIMLRGILMVSTKSMINSIIKI